MKLVKALVAVGIVCVGIQFVPYGRSHTNPPVTSQPEWDFPATKATFMRVCGNCHSNETTWPWYSSVAPVSWLVQSDVDEGREHLNVSTYDSAEPRHAADAAGEVAEKEMPPWFYVIGHPEAKLSEQERADFVQGLHKTFAQ